MGRTVPRSASAGMELTATIYLDSVTVAPASWDVTVYKVSYSVSLLPTVLFSALSVLQLLIILPIQILLNKEYPMYLNDNINCCLFSYKSVLLVLMAMAAVKSVTA